MSAALAIPAQGTTLVLGITATAVSSISAITKANPAVATKTSHGLTTGQVVKVASAGGMVEINGRIGIVRVLTADTFELGGIDSTAFTTYTTGASVTPTACKVSGLEQYQISGQAATQIPATDLDSTQIENLTGLSGAGSMTLTLQKVFSDDGQKALEASANTPGVNVAITLTPKGVTALTTTGACSKVDFSGGVDALTKGSADIVLAARFK